MNIFQKIGNRLEEDKKNKELFEKRYWNLTPIERIDYDNKRDRIEKETYYGMLPLTLIFLKGFIVFLLLFTSTFYLTGSIELSNLFMNISIILGNMVIIAILVDFLLSYISSVSYFNRIKNLNKRFKLDTRHI
jgi:hypothetical protein